MKIAFDGGAFQQGIAAGIFNTAIGLMNELSRQAPDISFTLVADPRLGPVRSEMLERLIVRPDIIEAPVGPAYAPAPKPLTTTDPRVVFEVDGELSTAKIQSGSYVYEGPPPRTSFRILSRSEQPSAVGLGGDGRRLGIGIVEIEIVGARTTSAISFREPRLTDGFHDAETYFRWTNGSARIPLDLFPPDDGSTTTVRVRPEGQMHYRVSEAFAAENMKIEDILGRTQQLTAVLELEKKLQSSGFDAYIANHFIPVYFRNIKTYAILYDIIPVLFPQYFGADARQNFMSVMDVFRNSQHVFSISEASRLDLIKAGGARANRVSSMMIDIGEEFTPAPKGEIEAARHRYGLTGKTYIITVGTLEPRKNHMNLIDAFARAFGDRPDMNLVVIGKHGWGTDGLMRRVGQLNLTERVRFLSNVPNKDLPPLYSGALLLAYPSLYEGFGLPVLEAMACGCPVLTSNRSSMPEIAGKAAVLVDPTNVGALAEELRKLAASPQLREGLAALGLRRRHEFSWQRSARHMLNVLMKR